MTNKGYSSAPADMLHAVVLKDTQEFAALEEDWEDLYSDSPLATPFQSWEWLYSWWEAYGEGYELRLIAMRGAGGLLVGLLPLMLERRFGFGRLLFIGTGITDHLDMLVRIGWETQVAEAGRWILQRMGSWHVADLQELRPTAATWDVYRNWVGPHIRVRQSDCVEIEAKPWEELLTHLSRNGREKARKTIRRAEQDGVRCELAGQDGMEQASRTWLALHREYWRGRGINLEHLTGRFGSHTLAAAKRMSASGSGGIYEFRRGEEVVASDFVLIGREYVASYLSGANEYALHRFQINSLFMWNWINVALERGIPTAGMLRGADQHKLRWEPKITANHRLFLGRDRISFVLYAAYPLLRARVVEYIKSENAPAWLKSATVWLKGFLPT